MPLSQAVEFYLHRHPTKIAPRAVADVIAEMIKGKEEDGLSAGYVKHLRYDLGKFAEAFHGSIGAVSGNDVDTWLRGLKKSPRTRNNLHSVVQTLFGYAKARKYLPKDHDELDAVARAKDGDGEIEVFTPAEMAEILTHADERMIPFLALGAFAGIRHAEIQRLDWKDIQFDAGIIELHAKKAKTASRRIVPLLDNLRAWLLPHREAGGPVCVYQNVASEIVRVVRDINAARKKAVEMRSVERGVRKGTSSGLRPPSPQRGEGNRSANRDPLSGEGEFVWKHNALRHSFISYRVAAIQNVAQVALEAGNSPQMIFKRSQMGEELGNTTFELPESIPASPWVTPIFERRRRHRFGRMGN